MEKKVIDWETAIERLGGDKDFLIELLNELIEQMDQSLPELKQAIEQNDYDNVRSIAHGLKGAAANLGADQIANAFYEMETMGKNQDLNTAMSKFEEILEMKESVKQEVVSA